MFSTLKSRMLLGLYIFLVISIPIGAYLVSQNQTVKSRASEDKPILRTTPPPAGGPTTSPAKDLLTNSQSSLEKSLDESPTPQTIATSIGPTLSLKASLQGRAFGNQASKLFVGIAEGDLSQVPKFLLSFTIDLPNSGQYDNLSLAGLTPGTKYTALLKGSSQIATSSSFIMSPALSNLNSGQPLTMLSGDLNDDNVINAQDYSLIQKAFGATSKEANWLEKADFNKDGVINSLDLSLVSKNLGQIGASGTWNTPISTPSASLNSSSSQGGPSEDSHGYWIWVPSH